MTYKTLSSTFNHPISKYYREQKILLLLKNLTTTILLTIPVPCAHVLRPGLCS